jgi:hypothetical protein
MPKISFDRLPDDARLWVFGAARPLNEAEKAQFLAGVDGFLADWRAHGAPLTCARELVEDRFLMVGVDEASVPPSGCSIDAMVNVLGGLEEKLGLPLVGHGAVFYRAPSGEVSRVERDRFRRLAEEGSVSPETVVFDTTLTRVGRFRDGGWERPARETWHGRAFFRPAPRGEAPGR